MDLACFEVEKKAFRCVILLCYRRFKKKRPVLFHVMDPVGCHTVMCCCSIPDVSCGTRQYAICPLVKIMTVMKKPNFYIKDGKKTPIYWVVCL